MKNFYDFCFIISDLLSTTPRAYREIKLAVKQGYKVCVVCNERRFEAIEYHKELVLELKKSGVRYIGIEWKSTSLRTIFFKILHKISLFLFSKFNITSKLILCLATDYTIYWQYQKSKNIKAKIYNGHRPASMPIINKLAKKYSAKTWFDIEDYHFEESEDKIQNSLIGSLIKKFPAKFYTDASELIGRAFLNKLNPKKTSLEILNSPLFETNNFNFETEKNIKNKEITFFWFSQTVTFGRGLELFFEALAKNNIQSKVHLVGSVDENFKTYIISLNLKNCKIIYHGFVSENKINELANQSDIGLALELNNVDVSRRYAITNKILTYSLFGCYILATSTLGQIDYMKRLSENGVLFDLNEEKLSQILKKINSNIKTIRNRKKERLQYANKLSWIEQEKKLNTFFQQVIN